MALNAYARRFGIEEMFRDFKTGGYNLEETGVQGQRLSPFGWVFLLWVYGFPSYLVARGKILKGIIPLKDED